MTYQTGEDVLRGYIAKIEELKKLTGGYTGPIVMGFTTLEECKLIERTLAGLDYVLMHEPSGCCRRSGSGMFGELDEED